jgi:hypothetical protein
LAIPIAKPIAPGIFSKIFSGCHSSSFAAKAIVFFQGKIGLQTLLLSNFPNKITILSANIA